MISSILYTREFISRICLRSARTSVVVAVVVAVVDRVFSFTTDGINISPAGSQTMAKPSVKHGCQLVPGFRSWNITHSQVASTFDKFLVFVVRSVVQSTRHASEFRPLIFPHTRHLPALVHGT